METIEGSIAVKPLPGRQAAGRAVRRLLRHGNLDPELRGPRVFKLLGVDSGRSVADAAMDEISLRTVADTAAALTARRKTAGRHTLRQLNAARHVWLSLALRVVAAWSGCGKQVAARAGNKY